MTTPREQDIGTFLTPDDVARQLQVATRTVYRWIDSGELPATRIGGLLRINPFRLEQRLAALDKKPPADRGYLRRTSAKVEGNRQMFDVGRGKRVVIANDQGPDVLHMSESAKGEATRSIELGQDAAIERATYCWSPGHAHVTVTEYEDKA